MTTIGRTVLAAAVSLSFTGLSAGDPSRSPQLVPRSTYDTGLGGDGAEVISVRQTDGLATLTNIAGSVDVLDLSNPLEPRRLHRVLIDTATGTPNSAAVHPQHDVFLVVTGAAGQIGTVAAHRLSDGALLAWASVGLQPDAIAIAPNGQFAVVANEAEGTGPGAHGGPGSLSLIDLRGFTGVGPGPLRVTPIALPSLAAVPGVSTGRTDDLARLPIDNLPDSLEPEYVTFSHDSRFAYVTLQENNIVLRLDVLTGALAATGVGQTTHAADLTVDGMYQPNQLLTAFREPDGIALDPTGRFFATADEGDTRNAAGGSGPRGGRTISVFDASTGALWSDTGSQLDDAAAAAGLYPDNRSDRGGSEPEGLDITSYRGVTVAAVALERANAVALVDLTNPLAPAVIDVQRAGIGPETVAFVRRGARLFVAAANEVSGTVSIFEVVF